MVSLIPTAARLAGKEVSDSFLIHLDGFIRRAGPVGPRRDDLLGDLHVDGQDLGSSEQRCLYTIDMRVANSEHLISVARKIFGPSAFLPFVPP